MRAVLARRAALLVLLAGFFVFVWLAVFADVLFAGASFFGGIFVAFLGVVAAEPSGAVAEPPELCPATGDTISSAESRTARQREETCGTNAGEDETLISPL